MATPMYREPPTEPSGPTRWVEPGPLWAGGVATAVVAALIALAGVLITRWLFGVPILAPRQDGAWGNVSTGMYVLSAASAAVNLVLGIAIGTLTIQVAARAVRRRRPSGGYQSRPPQSRTPGDQYR